MRALAVVLIGFLLTVVGVYAQDRVILKDGQIFEGKVEKENNKSVVLRTKYGVLRFPREKISKVEKGKPAKDEYMSKRKKIAQALFELALWCKKHGLKKQALRHLREVIKYDPDHEGARKLLGYIRKGKRWVKQKPQKQKPQKEKPTPKQQPSSSKMSRDEWRRLHVEAAKHLFAEEFEDALRIYRKILKAYPNDYLALYQSACALARLGKKKEALQFLKKAVDCGFNDAEKMGAEPDLQSLRNTEEFQKILRRISQTEQKTSPKKDDKKKERKKKSKVKFF